MKKSKITKQFPVLFLLLILLVPCICLVYHSTLNGDEQPYSVISSIAAIFSILGIFYFLYTVTMNTLKDSRQKAELLILEEQQRMKSDQNAALTKCRQETLALQQSMKQKLLTYESLMNEHRYEEATRYLEELTSDFQKERFHPICSDTLLNAILTNKRQVAVQYNIQTSFQLLLLENPKIESSDLSSIFST